MTARNDEQYVRNASIFEASLGPEETALLSAAQGKYYSLNGPAGRIWELLANPMTIAGICDVLTAEFDVDAESCRRDTSELIGELLADDLIHRVACQS